MEYGVMMLVAVIFGLVLMVAWIILPFAVIGTKPLLEELLKETRKTNKLLEQQARPVPPIA